MHVFSISSFSLFFQLPKEMTFDILSFLTAPDICSISQTCTMMKLFTAESVIWKNLCVREGWNVARTVVEEDRGEFDYQQYFAEKLTLKRPGALKWADKGKLSGLPPSKRFKHTATVVGKYMVIIGGQETDTKRFSEVHYFDSETGTFSQPAIRGDKVPKFSRHSAALVGGKIFLFGGFDGYGMNFDLAIFDPSARTWTNVANSRIRGTAPASRTNHAAAAVGNKMYVFGGNNNNERGVYQVLDDLNVLDVDTMTWSQPATSGAKPSARSGHTLTAIGQNLYLFGGGVWNERDGWVRKHSDVHVLDTKTMHWTQPACENNIDNSTFAITFAVGRFLYVFGGGSRPNHCVVNDLNVLDTASFTWVSVEAEGERPQPRDMGTACAVGGKVYLVGGYASGAVDYFNQLSVKNHSIFS